MRDSESFWKWSRQILVPGLYNTTWYNGKPFDHEEGFISNRGSFLVGMPRLRQIRIRPGKLNTRYIFNLLSYNTALNTRATHSPPQEVKMFCFCGLPSRTFEHYSTLFFFTFDNFRNKVTQKQFLHSVQNFHEDEKSTSS